MKISYNWLRDYLPFELQPAEIAEVLTRIGLEVEELHEWESVPGGLQGLVIGEVKEVVKHPNADKLSLTKVDIGNGALLNIVCGAPNVASGQRVIVAPVNTTIRPVSGEPFTIRKAKIRGEESEGMLCAEDEIGLGTSHDGIIVLDGDAPIGQAAAEYLGVVRDWVFDIAVTPNRADAMSHVGVARDVNAYFSYHRNEKASLKWPAHDLFKEGQDASVPVEVEDTKACPRYSGLTINRVTVTASPAWMQNRLKAIDVRPINNVVDVTNYVLHELGQPLHAFDADEIRGGRVVVRTLKEGAPFVTLDEQERKLSNEDLMICDAEGGMCIAGVFGGIGSGVTDKTTRVFLESAHFSPVSVRKTSFRHNLRTEAAVRFEKGTDPNITVTALERAAHLLKQMAAGVTFSKVVDVYPQPIAPVTVTATYHVMDRLIGAAITREAARPILEGMGMTVQSVNGSIEVNVPTWKREVEHPADLVEEVLRIYGMDRIEVAPRFVTSISHESDERYKQRDSIADWLASNGFHEMQSLSMGPAAASAGAADPAALVNPLSTEMGMMRSSMLFSGLEHIARNINHRELDLKLFEFGKTYAREKDGFREVEKLAIFVTGGQSPESWEQPQRPVTFFNVKAVSARVLERLGLKAGERAIESEHVSEALALTVSDRVVAVAGEVAGTWLRLYDIKQPVFYAELDWEACAAAALQVARSFSPLPRYPAIRRDLAIVVEENVPYADIERIARASADVRLRDVNLFDIYRDERIGTGKKSYAVAFTFRDEERTLTDEDADATVERIIASVERELGATIRRS